MGSTEVLLNVGSLQNELDRAKTNLRGLNENIRRIIGRDPNDIQLRGDRKRNFASTASLFQSTGNDKRNAGDFASYNNNGQRRRFNPHQPHAKQPDLAPAAKRRAVVGGTKSVFSRLSGPPQKSSPRFTVQVQFSDDDGHARRHDHGHDDPTDAGGEAPRPRLHSRVIRELPTRQEIVEAQGNDDASRARNRRMFGALLGTLQKFSQEESRLKTKEDRKAQIEQKLEEQQKLERETMRRERQDLFANRKRQQMEIKQLETKMARMRELEAWEASKQPLLNYIQTKTKPRLYYLPKIVDGKAAERLAECRADLEKKMSKRRAEVTDELAAIEERFRLNTDASKADESDEDVCADASAKDNDVVIEDTNAAGHPIDVSSDDAPLNERRTVLLVNNYEQRTDEDEEAAGDEATVTGSTSLVVIKRERIDERCNSRDDEIAGDLDDEKSMSD